MAASLSRPYTDPAVPQGHVLAAITVLALGNAMAGRAWETIVAEGWLNALGDGLGQSWAFWLAAILAVRLAAHGAVRAASRTDLTLAGLCLVAVALPATHYVSGVALTLVGAWFAWRAASPRIRGAAFIVLALAVNLLWIGAAMLAFGAYAERLDARIVGLLTGAVVQGNIIHSLHGGSRVIVYSGCTAVTNASMALLMWFAIARSARPALRPTDLLVAAGVALSVFVLNTARLVVVAQSPAGYHLAHGPVGSPLYNALVTVTGLAWALWDVRKELFDADLGGDAGVAVAERRRQAAAVPPG
jgi:hypothetical protein